MIPMFLVPLFVAFLRRDGRPRGAREVNHRMIGVVQTPSEMHTWIFLWGC